ncbi:hypothetical protein [Microbacterium sp. PMB16]|uniref:hypothetical protein n=1 Tax=Microbacterium sp. PMB16 TaxID=3120157 RepID=UPI003F4BBE25
METETVLDRQAIIRRLSWSIAWAVPVIAAVTGISLTAAGTVQQVTDYDLTILTVWPAGLVLLAVGLLGVTAAAIAAAVTASKTEDRSLA